MGWHYPEDSKNPNLGNMDDLPLTLYERLSPGVFFFMSSLALILLSKLRKIL